MKNVKKIGVGRKAHAPTEESRKIAYKLSGLGCPHEDIALRLGISADTLVKYYKNELDLGRINANAIMAGTLVDQAKNGNVAAAIFWLKTRAGWKETTQHDVNLTVIPKVIEVDKYGSDDEWEREVARQQKELLDVSRSRH